MAINFLWEEIWVGKEMAALANKCCFSNLLMLSDDLSLFESFGLFYQGKCIIRWSCVKNFFQTHIYKTQYHLKLANTKSSNQYLMACTSKEAWRIFCHVISKGDFTYHISPDVSFICSSQKRVSLVMGIWMVFTKVSPEVVPRVFTPIWREKDERRTLGDNRLRKTLFWELLYGCLCGLQRYSGSDHPQPWELQVRPGVMM